MVRICRGIIYYDSLSNNYFHYFSNFKKNKWIHIFDLNGNRLDSIDLSFLKGKVDHLRMVYFINTNKIIASDQKGRTFLFTKESQLIKQFNLNNEFENIRNENIYEFLIGNVNSREKKDFFYVYPFWTSTDNFRYSTHVVPLAEKNYREYINLRVKKTRDTPFCFELSLFEPFESRYILKEYNNYIIPEKHYTNNLLKPSFTFDNNNNIIISSKYSDSIWVYNLVTNEKSSFLIDEVKLTNKPIDLTTTNIPLKIGEFLKGTYQKAKTSSYISKIIFDKYCNRFYVIIKHPLSTQQGDNLKLDFGFEKKSLLVYNKNFELTGKVTLEKGEYRSLIRITNEGLLISTHNPNKIGYKPNIYTYEVFNITD